MNSECMSGLTLLAAWISPITHCFLFVLCCCCSCYFALQGPIGHRPACSGVWQSCVLAVTSLLVRLWTAFPQVPYAGRHCCCCTLLLSTVTSQLTLCVSSVQQLFCERIAKISFCSLREPDLKVSGLIDTAALSLHCSLTDTHPIHLCYAVTM